eukprot:TRINITY_DN15560_c0_g1_i3.p1 TRINITY_DN15560_c0_g1~~TRINITY_DN15560_c0_g1_i3.p1  ORF type:complete len:116 (-),score=26.30 TRINITY_DN15560_c0_g1_i3:34-381(-)
MLPEDGLVSAVNTCFNLPSLEKFSLKIKDCLLSPGFYTRMMLPHPKLTTLEIKINKMKFTDADLVAIAVRISKFPALQSLKLAFEMTSVSKISVLRLCDISVSYTHLTLPTIYSV